MHLPDIIVLLGNSVRWQTELLIGAAQGKQIDDCQLTVSLYCLFCFHLHATAERVILNSEMADVIGILTLLSKQVFWNWSGWEIMSRVLHNEKVRAISTLASGQDLLTVLKTYTTFTSCQNAACSNTFFFCWQVDYALEGSPF